MLHSRNKAHLRKPVSFETSIYVRAGRFGVMNDLNDRTFENDRYRYARRQADDSQAQDHFTHTSRKWFSDRRKKKKRNVISLGTFDRGKITAAPLRYSIPPSRFFPRRSLLLGYPTRSLLPLLPISFRDYSITGRRHLCARADQLELHDNVRVRVWRSRTKGKYKCPESSEFHAETLLSRARFTRGL